MNVSIGKGNSPTLTYVEVGVLELAFSYTTVIAYRESWGPWIKSENVWSKTTGKHLNEIPGTERTPRAEFVDGLSEVLARLDNHKEDN